MPRPISSPGCVQRGFLALAILLVPLAAVASHQGTQSTPPSTQNNTSDSDAAAKAAARKKKFQEDARRLEENGNNLQPPPASPDQTLFVSPGAVAMLPGDEHSFTLFDIDGHNLTSQAEWSVSNSSVADLAPRGMPTIKAKSPGTVTVRARVGSSESEAEVKVYEGKSLPAGTITWSVPSLPGYTSKNMSQAMPSANGPDLYTTETNAAGDMLIRAFYSDGRQMWMSKMAPHSAPPSNSKRSPPAIIPH
jgi:hypothetical protein